MSEASDTDSSLFSPLQGEEKRNLTLTTSPNNARLDSDATNTANVDPSSPLPQLLAEHLVTVKLQAEEKIHSLKHENRLLRQRLEVKTDENRVMKQKLHVRESMNTDPTKRTLDFSNMEEDYELEEDERGDPAETDAEDDPIAITWNLGNQEFSNGRYQDGVKHYTIAAKMLVSNLASAEAKVSRMSAELEETTAERAALEKEMVKMKTASEQEETANRDRIIELEKELERQDELARENAEMLVAAQMKDEKLKQMEDMLEQLKADNFRLAELESHNRELESELSELQQKLETAEVEKDGSLQRFETQQAEFAEQSGLLEAAKAQLESIQREAELAKIAQEEQQELLDQLQKENMSLQEQAAHVEIEWSSKMDALEISTKADKDTLQEQEAVIAELKGQSASVEQELLNLRSEAADLTSQLSDLRKENESLQAESSRQLDEHEAEKSRHAAENTRLQDAVSKLSGEMETIEEQYKRELKVKEDLSTMLNDKLEETLAEFATVSSAKLSLEEERESLLKELTEKQSALELHASSESLEAEKVSALTEEKDRFAEEKESLLKEKENLERAVEETKKELAERNDKFKKLAKKYKQLRDAKDDKPQEQETVKKELFEKVMESESDLKFIVEEQAARIEELQVKLKEMSDEQVQATATQESFPIPSQQIATAPVEANFPEQAQSIEQRFPAQQTEVPAEAVFAQHSPMVASQTGFQQQQAFETFNQPANDAAALFGADAPPADGNGFAMPAAMEDVQGTTDGVAAQAHAQDGDGIGGGFEQTETATANALFDSAPPEDGASMFENRVGAIDADSENTAQGVFDAPPAQNSGPPLAKPSSERGVSTAEGFFAQESPEEVNTAFNSSNTAPPFGGPPQASSDVGLFQSSNTRETAHAAVDSNPGYPETQETAEAAFQVPLQSMPSAPPVGGFYTDSAVEASESAGFGAPPQAEQFFGTQAGSEQPFGTANVEDEVNVDGQTYSSSNAGAAPPTDGNSAFTVSEGAPAAADFFDSVPVDNNEAAGELFERPGLSSSGPNQNEVEPSADGLFQQPPTSAFAEPSEPHPQGVQQPGPSEQEYPAEFTKNAGDVVPAAADFFSGNPTVAATHGEGFDQSAGIAPAADGLFEEEQQTSDVFAQNESIQHAPTLGSSQFPSEAADQRFGTGPAPAEAVQGSDLTRSEVVHGVVNERQPSSPADDNVGTRSVGMSESVSIRDNDSLSVQASSVANVQEAQQVILEGDDLSHYPGSVPEAPRSEDFDSASVPASGQDPRTLIRAMTAEDVEELNQAKADASNLSAQLQESQRELNEKQAELELAMDGMSALKAENASLNQRVEEGTKAQKEAEAAMECLRQRLEDLELQRGDLQGKLDETKNEAEALAEEKTELESAISALNDELSSAHGVLGGLEGNAKQERSEAQQEISRLQEQMKQLSIEVDSKQGILKNKEEELEAASRSLSEMESTIEAYTTKLTDNEETLAKQQRETEYLNEQFQELQDLIVTEKEERKKLQLELEQVQSETQKRASMKVEEAIELAELKSANDILQQEVESIKNREITRVSELEERQLYLQSQIASLESERVGLKNELELVKSSRTDVEEKDKALLSLTSKWNKLLVVLKRMEYERDRALDEASTMYEFDLSGEIEQEVGKAPLRRIRKSPPQSQKSGGFEDSNGTDFAIGGEPSEGWNRYIQNLTSEVDSYRIINEGNGNGNSNGFSPKGKLLSVNSASFEAEEKVNAEELEALRAKCNDMEAESEQVCKMLLTKTLDCQDEVSQCMTVLEGLERMQSVQTQTQSFPAADLQTQALQADLQELMGHLEECLHLSDRSLQNRATVYSTDETIILEEKHGDEEVISELSKQVEDCITLAQKLEETSIVADSSVNVIEQKEPDGYTERIVSERDTALAELKSLRHQLALRKSIFGGKAPLQPRASIVEETMNLRSPSSPSRSIKISPRGLNSAGTPASSSGPLGRSVLASDRLSTPAPTEFNPDSPLVTPWSDKYWNNSDVGSSLPPQPAKLDLDSLSPAEDSEGMQSENASGTNVLEPSMRDRSFRDSELPISQPVSSTSGEADNSDATTAAQTGESANGIKKRRSNSGKRFVSQMFGIHSKVEAEVSLSDNNSDFASEEEDPEEKPKPVTNVMSDPFTAARNTSTRSRSSTTQSYQHTSPKTSPLQYGKAAPPAPPVNLVRPGSPHMENTPSADYQTSWPIIDSSVASSPPEIVGDPTDSMQTVGASSPFPNSPGMVDSNGLLWVAPGKEDAETEAVNADGDGDAQNQAVDANELQSQVEKLREENTKALGKVKELENQLEIERDARIWRERQQCVTETELERVIEANEELHERLAVLTSSLESAQEQVSRLSQADGTQAVVQETAPAAVEEELNNCKLEIMSLREQLEAAHLQLEARQNEPQPPVEPVSAPPVASTPPMDLKEEKPVLQVGTMDGAEKRLNELRALLTARELDVKNLTEQLSNKYYAGVAQGTVSHRPRKFRHRQGRGCLSFTRRFVIPNMLVVLLAIVAALGASSSESPVDVRPRPT